MTKAPRRTKVLRLMAGLIFAGAVVAAALLTGWFLRDRNLTPLADLIPRIERKIGEMQGEPPEIVKDFARIETTFLQLTGTVMRPPGIDYINGGALTVRGADLIVMNRRGGFYATDGTGPIRALGGLAPPENGLSAYEAFAATEEGRTYSHNAARIRFNDVQWIETAERSGLALSYTFYDAEAGCYGTRVAWAALDAAAALDDLRTAAGDWRVLFQTRPCLALSRGRVALDGLMAGGRMAFAAPSTLYLGSGDYHLDGITGPDGGVQADDSDLGKVIAIEIATGAARHVSKGHRNLQGMALDRAGRLWTTEHAERGGDELNLIEDGNNYGWPRVTLGTLYSGQPFPGLPYGRHEGYTEPVFAWLPSAAVSSLMVIDGIDPSWDGDLLAGSLSSPEFGQSLWHIRTEGDRVIFVERIRLGHRVRYLTQFGQRIALWLDSNDLVLLDAARRADPLEAARAHLASAYDADLAAEVDGVLEGCNQCHSFAQNEHLTGPSLNGVVGRAVASTGFTGYSDALKSHGGDWTPDRLNAWLADPGGVTPGTAMPDTGLRPGPVLDALVAAMAEVDSMAAPDLTYD